MLLNATSLAGLPGISHAFFTREGGVSQGVYASLNGGLGSSDERSKVIENRTRMAKVLGVEPHRFATVHQVHSPDVAVVEDPWDENLRPRADAIVTAKPGLAIAVSTADCGPLLFADAQARVVGAAHSGWKGALGGVIEATVAAMERKGARRERIHAALGPTISRGAYEVGPEFPTRFLEQDSASKAFFTPAERAGHSMFDLPAYIGARLAACGVGSVSILGRCTYQEEALFYSYRRMTHRREADYGRMLSAIALQA